MLFYLKCLSICNLSIAELIQAALPKMIIFQLGTNRTQYSTYTYKKCLQLLHI